MKIYIVWFDDMILKIFKNYNNAVEFATEEILQTGKGREFFGNGRWYSDFDRYTEAISSAFDENEYFNDYFIEEQNIADM